MASKRINTFTNIILPCLVFVATIVLAILLRPQETTALYWVNLVYGVILELIFFGWLCWVRTDSTEVSPLLSIMMGTYAAFYVTGGAICILVSGIVSLTTEVSVKWYVAALIVLTLLWLIPAALMAQADSTHAENQAQVADKREELLRRSAERRENARKK